MLWKRSGLLVGVKVVPVLSRKDVFKADIGPFVNDCAKTSMVAPLYYSIYFKKIWLLSEFKLIFITKFWNNTESILWYVYECFSAVGVDDQIAYYVMVTPIFILLF